MPLVMNNTEVRTLIINDNQKYRLLIGNNLKYAKGFINFDANCILDEKGDPIPYTYQGYNILDGIYAFFNDGFYSYNNNNDSWILRGNNLSNMSLYSSAAVFNGWYTSPENGIRINSIDDIYYNTNLFNYSDSESIPEITLYAHWNIKTYNVTVHNIVKLSDKGDTTTSSFIYNGNIINNSITISNVPLNTELVSFLNQKIQKPKYVTWARNKLDGTNEQQNLRRGPQEFLGWYTSEDGQGTVLSEYYVTSDISVYPQFAAIVIWPNMYNLNNRNWGYWTSRPPLTISSAMNHAPQNDSSVWRYDNDAFPLGSADTYVVNHL